MKDALVLVLPSTWYEGFPMILAEAFAVGLPVIASNLGSMSSIVDHRRTGLHFEPGNASDLVDKVRWLRAHPREAMHMRTQARLEYERKYTGDRNYEQLMHIYESVVSPPGQKNAYEPAFASVVDPVSV
jgi:glycosyltransferase involved in cell wall biosynthesis